MFNSIKISLPIISTIKTYQRSWLTRDAIAGVTVAAVAVPQAMAYAQLAGLPLIVGLYTAIVSMLIFAMFTSSKFAIVGPDAAMAALTGATIIPLANGNSSKYLAMVAVLAILIGVTCLVSLYLHLGVLAELISRPILMGYMTGLALAVIASQAPKLFGITVPLAGNFFSILWYIPTHLSSINWVTLLLSIIILICAFALQKYAKKLPMSLVVLVGSIIASFVFSFSEHGIKVVGSVPTGLPLPNIPTVNFTDFQYLVVPALMIALVSYANTITTTRSFAKRQNENIEVPQEFFGLGVANIGSGLFGGMPVAASGARTAVNLDSNAQTQVSQLFGAVAIGFVLIFLSKTLSYLPLASLAVIVIMAVSNLFNYKELKSIWHGWRSEAILAIITIIGVTILGIFQGLLLAIILAILNLVRKNAFPKYAVLGVAENGAVRDMSRPPKTKPIPGMIIFRFDSPLYFINSNTFKEAINNLIDESSDPVQWVLWDAETVTEIDSTSAQMLLSLIKELKLKDITFAIARMKGPVRETIRKSKRLSRTIYNLPHFTSLGDAIEGFDKFKETSPDKVDV